VGAASQDFAELPDFSREPVLTEASDAPRSADTPVMFEPQARKVPWGWLFLVALLSLLAFAFMYRDVVMTEVELLKKYLLRGTPAAPAPADSPSSAISRATSALPMASQAATEAMAAASAAGVIAPTPQAPASSPPLAASAAISAIEKPTPAAVNPAVATASEAKPSTAPTKSLAKATEDTSDAAWLKQLPTNGYVVQLAAFDTEEEVLAFKRANKLYEKARVLSPRKKGTTRRYFILVAGPFENKVDADAYMRTNPLLAKAWLRNNQSIQSQFDRP
jgi:septal ring-binding cell division protein DamX